MKRSPMYRTVMVFFCLVGWIYAGPATGASEGDDPVNEPTLGSVEALPAEEEAAPAEEAPPVEDQDAAPEPGTSEEEGTVFDPDAAPVETHSTTTPIGVDAGPEPEIEENAFGRIDLAIQDQDIAKVLQMLALQSKRNILPSPSVSGNISAALYDVDFYEAMDAILRTNGFGYREDGNFIYVYTAQELKEIDERDRKTVSEIVWVNYEPAENLAKAVEPMLTPGRGTIAFSASATPGFVATTANAGQDTSASSAYLIIHDYPEKVAEMRELIKQLDIKPPMVQIDATILEARLNEDNAWGVDLTILSDFAMSEFTTPLSVINNLVSGAVGPSGAAAQTTVGSTTTGSSGVRVGIVTSDVAAFIRALDTVTDTTVLAHPKLITLNRQPAKLIAGEKLGYISTTATETSTTQTVEFLEVGTKLTVRPFVSNDDFIRLELQPEISEGEVQPVADFVIPNETTSELIANVRVPNGRTVVLGGLFKEATTITRNQVPYLGNIPLLGAAFQGRDDEVRRSEVIFLIRPTIVKDATMVSAGERAAEDAERLRIGSRDGLLPWSRSRMTAEHLTDAYRYHAEGRDDKALMSVNMALEMDPTIVEAQRLKAELTENNIVIPDEGVLKHHLDTLIDQQLQDEAQSQTSDAQTATPSQATAEANTQQP